MGKISRIILDSLKVTDDDDEFEDDDQALKERKQKEKAARKEAATAKREAPSLRRYDNSDYDDEEDEENPVAQARADRAQAYRERNTEKSGYTSQPRYRYQQQTKIQDNQSQEKSQYRSAPPMRAQASTGDVCIIRPKKYEDCPEIIDVLKSGRVVFINFDSSSPAVANRIMDFIFGAVYALDCQIIQVSGNNFVLAMEDIEISGEYLKNLSAGRFDGWSNGLDSNGKR